jgi:hypothetical protein
MLYIHMAEMEVVAVHTKTDYTKARLEDEPAHLAVYHDPVLQRSL